MKRTSNHGEEEDVGGRRIIVARPRSLSTESDASSPENLQVITANMKKGMKKSLSSRLGPVDPGVQQQQFSEKEMLRQQERRRIAIEEKEIRKLKKAMKKKEKLERKLKKHDKKESKKKSKKDNDSDFSEGDMLVSGNQTLKSLYLQFSLATWLLLKNSVSFFTLLQMLFSHLLLRLRAHISESVVPRVRKEGPERDSHQRVE